MRQSPYILGLDHEIVADRLPARQPLADSTTGPAVRPRQREDGRSEYESGPDGPDIV